ncbi:hypothetical protein RB195_014506 [Necator americanus]|uniref:Ankyrin repeat protein n=2 Tax=Necator americanus TaxID=51031 RepID=A0ABR1E0G0_NECAM
MAMRQCTPTSSIETKMMENEQQQGKSHQSSYHLPPTMGSANSVEPREGEVGGGRLREDMKLYRMIDMHGGGEMMTMMRYAKATNDFSFVDHYIKTRVSDFLLNNEKGKLFAITELVSLRNKERNAKLGAFLRKKGKGKAAVNVLEGFDQNGAKTGDLKKALKLLDGGGKGGKSELKYRELNWKLDERGSMGETIIGVCLLQGTTIHNILALRILDFYPKLVNDICTSEDYYGLSPLHQAIINHDVEMASKLLRRGADVNQRCYGAFFCADDQKSSRTDSLEHEYVDLTENTNYTGTMYFGEYPLSFAVCMNQPDLFRLLIARKANLNAQDTNGNTVLHLCVIHEKIEMMKLALEAGARLNIANKQNLTPLTLAAKLAKKKLFNLILELEGQSVWVYGEASCSSYPLTKIDTINEVTGEMNEESALSLVVYGEAALEDLMMQAKKIKYDVIGLTEKRRRHPLNAVYETGEEVFLGTCNRRGWSWRLLQHEYGKEYTLSNLLRPESDVCR